MCLIIKHLNELDYYEEPRYNPIKAHLIQTAKKGNADLNLPLDWPEEKKEEVSEGIKQEREDDKEEDK